MQLEKRTPREHEVVLGLVRGHPKKTMSHNNGISTQTVEIHRANLITRLGVVSLSGALRIAFAVEESATDPKAD